MGREQNRRVRVLFSSGRLTIKRQGSETELNILMAGVRDRNTVRIEITHPWGRPLLHVLLREKRFQILSFTEKRYYFGLLGKSERLGLFPDGLDHDQIWTVVRGYPVIPEYKHAISSKENQITLFNENGEKIQVMDFHPSSKLPRLIFFPREDMSISFSDFQNEAGIHYARRIQLDAPDSEGHFTVDVKQVVFNKTIPEEIFELEKPDGFKVVPMQQPLGK